METQSAPSENCIMGAPFSVEPTGRHVDYANSTSRMGYTMQIKNDYGTAIIMGDPTCCGILLLSCVQVNKGKMKEFLAELEKKYAQTCYMWTSGNLLYPQYESIREGLIAAGAKEIQRFQSREGNYPICTIAYYPTTPRDKYAMENPREVPHYEVEAV